MQWIKTDGTIEEVALDKDNSLKQMQDAVGGYIELVRLTDDDVMIVNEEGLIFVIYGSVVDVDPPNINLNGVRIIFIPRSKILRGMIFLLTSCNKLNLSKPTFGLEKLPVILIGTNQSPSQKSAFNFVSSL